MNVTINKSIAGAQSSSPCWHHSAIHSSSFVHFHFAFMLCNVSSSLSLFVLSLSVTLRAATWVFKRCFLLFARYLVKLLLLHIRVCSRPRTFLWALMRNASLLTHTSLAMDPYIANTSSLNFGEIYAHIRALRHETASLISGSFYGKPATRKFISYRAQWTYLCLVFLELAAISSHFNTTASTRWEVVWHVP